MTEQHVGRQTAPMCRDPPRAEPRPAPMRPEMHRSSPIEDLIEHSMLEVGACRLKEGFDNASPRR